MADEGNLNTIILIAHDLAIDEVRVGQSNQVLSASGATYYPSHTVKRQAFTGFDVLSKLGMEQLVFNRQNESVSTMTGGSVQILLNGEPVTTKELTKLPPKQMQRMEFSDVPSALYPDAAGVLNVVVKRPETGGDFHGETTQPLHGQAELGARRDCALLPSPSAADRRLLTVLELPKADRVRRI